MAVRSGSLGVLQHGCETPHSSDSLDQQNGANERTRDRQFRPKSQAFPTQIGKQHVFPKDCSEPNLVIRI